MTNEELKARFVELMNQAAGKRKGFKSFMAWLESTDFFTAPASTKYHLAEEGGLLRHTMNVHDRLSRRREEAKARNIGEDAMTVAALLHDVCKTGRYRRKEKGDGYAYNADSPLPVGHGERSVILVQQYMPLTPEEIVAIRWHMGGWDDAVKGGSGEPSVAFRKYPLALMLHLADMEATYLDEA